MFWAEFYDKNYNNNNNKVNQVNNNKNQNNQQSYNYWKKNNVLKFAAVTYCLSVVNDIFSLEVNF